MEQVRKILFNKIEPFIQFLRTIRGLFLFRIAIVAVSGIFIIFAFFSFLGFRYYSDLVQRYYSALLRDTYLYVPYFIKIESYSEDFGWICRKLKERKGVDEVWVVDRTGRLIYHTSKEVRERFYGKRLPEEYRESIEKMWKFSNGYPVIEFVKAGSYLKIRSSIPLYVSGKGMYDFILGIDVNKFLLPSNFPDRIFFYLLLGGFILAVAIIFVPLYFWIGSLIDDLSTNARVLAGSLETELEKSLSAGAEIGREVPGEKLEGEKEVTREPEKKESVKRKIVEEKEPEAKPEPVVRVGEKGKEKVSGKKLPVPVLLIDRKQQLLQKKQVKTGFFTAGSFSLRTRNPFGNYVLYYNKNEAHLYLNLLFTEQNIENALMWIDEISAEIKRKFREVDEIHKFSLELNDWLLDKKRILNLSFIFFEKSSKEIIFSSFGSSGALYIKNNSEELKDIKLAIPGLGTVQRDELQKVYKYSEIDFKKGDLLFLPPHTEVAQRIGIDFKEILRDEIGIIKTLDVDGIISHLQKKLEGKIEDRKSAPELGFVVVRYT